MIMIMITNKTKKIINKVSDVLLANKQPIRYVRCRLHKVIYSTCYDYLILRAEVRHHNHHHHHIVIIAQSESNNCTYEYKYAQVDLSDTERGRQITFYYKCTKATKQKTKKYFKLHKITSHKIFTTCLLYESEVDYCYYFIIGIVVFSVSIFFSSLSLAVYIYRIGKLTLVSIKRILFSLSPSFLVAQIA